MEQRNSHIGTELFDVSIDTIAIVQFPGVVFEQVFFTPCNDMVDKFLLIEFHHEPLSIVCKTTFFPNRSFLALFKFSYEFD